MRNEHKTADNPWGSSWGEDEKNRVVINFPVMLRKMWSGSEVQAWISDLPPLYTHPAMALTDEEYKPLTQEDAPYQKVAPKEITDEISKALGLKTLTENEVSKYWYNKGHEDGRKLAVVKELTDEEITQTWIESTSISFNEKEYTHIQFARAVLLKASSK